MLPPSKLATSPALHVYCGPENDMLDTISSQGKEARFTSWTEELATGNSRLQHLCKRPGGGADGLFRADIVAKVFLHR
jgi:hypothetical protein